MAPTTEFVEGILDADQISYGTAEREQRAADWGTDDADAVTPDVVVWPESTADIAAVLTAANEHGVPVTPYAAGTSLEGNAVPVERGITLDLSEMDAVLDIRPDDLQVDVQPGIFGDDLNEAVADYGLFVPSLPASSDISTIGGMIANDASGTKTVKYGEVADWVLELEVVLPTGELITVGSKAAKTSAGYNLKELVIGSEGTLGVVTRATIELTGRPEQIRGGRAIFDDLGSATAAVADAVQSGVDVAKIELIDAFSAEVSNAFLDTDLPDSPMVFLEFHANHSVEEEIGFCRAVFEANDVARFEIADDNAEMRALWEARRELAEAFEPYDPDRSPLTPGDITVPISSYPEIIDYAKQLEAEKGIPVACFGHAGDGNVHYFIMVEPDDPESVATGEEISERLVERAIELGGTATGEHGVGLGKRDYLTMEYDDAGLESMRAIKRALDPNNVLNPGKILPEE
ncbi:FAD-binding oxidoreductase [Halorubrum sp. SD690R]|uniref:FAD-binding oxidoreductase n=1 Tax=unclassified Halorubrum TaxID=2642239 RepID=UPI000C068A22|nr:MULTISPECIES: FAD-binding oxidoreductase [unclassified Halorubrum]PHQ42221.1 lactate dehydrogenase [Halorubrum sp. C191]TKX43643.1 FAD-binding oxidoreductase [Halorubrum sp. SD690R]